MSAPLPRVSVVMPVLDEADGIVRQLEALQGLRAAGHEVIVADGGSSDETRALARPLADTVIRAPRGRAHQMNAGAARAAGDVLLFLHADTRLPDGADRSIAAALAAPGRSWGRFDVVIEGRSAWFPVIAGMMNLRSRLTGIATGDQAIFCRREAFDAVGGYPPIALMEDLALSRALRRFARPVCLAAHVRTSGRRWERHGILRTILLMWRLRFAWWCGVAPERLARAYAPHDAPR